MKTKKELIEELVEYVFLNYSKQKVGKAEDGTLITRNILDGKPRVFSLYENIEEIVNTFLGDYPIEEELIEFIKAKEDK